MITIKKNILGSILVGMMVITTAQAKNIPFQEDAYSMQAPENVVSLVEKAAKDVDFTSDYEVVVPKKAGIEINPWNKFAGYTMNPFTKNPLLIINPEWFFQLPEDQQLFLIGRNLLLLKHGVTPTSFTIINYAFIVISLLLLLLIYWILGKTALKKQSIWIRILMVCVIVGISEFILLDPLQIKVKQYFGKLHDKKIHDLVLQKLNNKDAAIKALEYYDSSIKNEIKSGDTFFIPYEHLFETYIQDLKSSR